MKISKNRRPIFSYKQDKEWLLIGVFFAAVLLKYTAAGFRYYPILDDYIQYQSYSNYQEPFIQVLVNQGVLFARPLAGIFDIYVWSAFWENLYFAVLLVGVLYALSGIFFYKAAQKIGVNLSGVFFLVYALMPLGVEGTYWLSASSRIVVSLFFMSAGLLLLANGKLWLFFILSIVANGFYEQTIILNTVTAVMLLLIQKKYKLIVLPSASFGLIVAFYALLGRMSNNRSRMETVDLNNIQSHISRVCDDITNLWGRANIPLYTNGIPRGLHAIIQNRAYVWAALALVTAAFWYIANRDAPALKRREYGLGMIAVGVIMFVAPYSLFFIMKNPWISMRNAAPSFLGFALIAEGLTAQIQGFRKTKSALVSVLFVILITANFSEINDYTRSGELDMQIAQAVVTGITNQQAESVVLNTKAYYVDQNIYYHEHINSITESEWALTGAARALTKNPYLPNVTPHKEGENPDTFGKNVITLNIEK